MDYYKPLRSLLFVPGNREDMMYKSLKTEADALIFDLEDSVPDDYKDKARYEVGKIINSQKEKSIYVRINEINSPWILDDVIKLSKLQIKGFVIPKITEPEDITKILWLLNCKNSQLQIIPIIETAKGIMNVDSIAKIERIEAIMFGAIDYLLDIKGSSEEEISTIFPRAKLINACRTYGLSPIDTVFPDFRNNQALEKECIKAKAMGFSGKACIHPNQIAIINKIFGPQKQEIEWAQRVIKAYEKALSEGKGAVSVDGMMVDEPVVKKATDILKQVVS